MRSLPVGTFEKALDAVAWIETHGNNASARKEAARLYNLGDITIRRTQSVKNSIIFEALSTQIKHHDFALEHAACIAMRSPDQQEDLLKACLERKKSDIGRFLKGDQFRFRNKRKKIVRAKEMVSVPYCEIMELMNRLKDEGKKSEATMSPVTVLHLALRVIEMIGMYRKKMG